MTTSAMDKGYDADADQLLKTSPVPALRQLTVEVTDEELILSGTVGSYYLKQLAQETVLPAQGNRVIVNRIRVVSRASFQTGQSAGGVESVPHQPATLSEMLRRVLVQPTNGIVGLVDDLLGVCLEHSLQLDWLAAPCRVLELQKAKPNLRRLQLYWQADRCRVHSFGDDWNELVDVPLRKSVLRAILARVATLCNQRTPNSVSPYGGQGELSVGANPAAVLRVAFVNTPTTQKLQLTTADHLAAQTAQQHEVIEPYGKPAEPNNSNANPPPSLPERVDDFSDK